MNLITNVHIGAEVGGLAVVVAGRLSGGGGASGGRFPCSALAQAGKPQGARGSACGLDRAKPVTPRSPGALRWPSAARSRTGLGQSGHWPVATHAACDCESSTRSPSRVVWLPGRQRGRLAFGLQSPPTDHRSTRPRARRIRAGG